MSTQFKKPIVGIMGPGNSASQSQEEDAFILGRLVAESGYHLLSGGGPGTMEYACRGAKEAGGLVVGILSGYDTERMNPYVDIPIVTNMGSGRNYMNILSSDKIIAVGSFSAGTLSEIAFALGSDKPILLYGGHPALYDMVAHFRENNPAVITNNLADVEKFLA